MLLFRDEGLWKTKGQQCDTRATLAVITDPLLYISPNNSINNTYNMKHF